MLKKLDTSSMNQEEDNSVIVEFNTDDRVDDITDDNDFMMESENRSNIDSCINTQINNDIKEPTLFIPIKEEIKTEESNIEESVEYKCDLMDYNEHKDGIIDIVHHNIKDEDSNQ